MLASLARTAGSASVGRAASSGSRTSARCGVERALASDELFEPIDAGGDLSESVRRRTRAKLRTAPSGDVVPSWARAARTPAGDCSMAWFRASSALGRAGQSARAMSDEHGQLRAEFGEGRVGLRLIGRRAARHVLRAVGIVDRGEARQDLLERREVGHGLYASWAE